jgi:hypothetical protein
MPLNLSEFKIWSSIWIQLWKKYIKFIPKIAAGIYILSKGLESLISGQVTQEVTYTIPLDIYQAAIQLTNVCLAQMCSCVSCSLTGTHRTQTMTITNPKRDWFKYGKDSWILIPHLLMDKRCLKRSLPKLWNFENCFMQTQNQNLH